MSSYTCRNIYPYDMFKAFESEIINRNRRDFVDALFSVPEGDICLVRWYEMREVISSDTQSNIKYSIVLDIINPEESDFTPLDFTPFKGWIERLEARIKQLEELCCDVWTWANYPHELTEGKALHDRMELLGLLEMKKKK